MKGNVKRRRFVGELYIFVSCCFFLFFKISNIFKHTFKKTKTKTFREKDEKQSILKWCMHLRNGLERRIGSQCVSHHPCNDEGREVVKESVGGDFNYVNIWKSSEPRILNHIITFEGEEDEEEGETNKLEIMRPYFLGKMSYRQLGLEEKFEDMMEQNRVPKGLTR